MFRICIESKPLQNFEEYVKCRAAGRKGFLFLLRKFTRKGEIHSQFIRLPMLLAREKQVFYIRLPVGEYVYGCHNRAVSFKIDSQTGVHLNNPSKFIQLGVRIECLTPTAQQRMAAKADAESIFNPASWEAQ